MAEASCFLGGPPQASGHAARSREEPGRVGSVRAGSGGPLRCSRAREPAVKGPGACRAARSLQSCRTLCDPVIVARQAPPSTGFSRQEHWTGLPCPPLGDLPTPGMEFVSPVLQGHSLLTEPSENPRRLRAVVKYSYIYFQQNPHLLFIIQSTEILSEEVVPGRKFKKKKKTFCVYSHRKGFTLPSHGFLSFIPQVLTEHSTSAR